MKKLFLIPLFVFLSQFLFAQNLTSSTLGSMRTEMQKQSDNGYYINTVAITRTAGVYIYGGNGWQCFGNVPLSLQNKIKEFNSQKLNIIDVHITESGEWAVVGDKISVSDNVPQGIKNSMYKLINNDKDYITCISFNSYGDWCVLGKNYFYASPKVQEYVSSASKAFGQVNYVNITNDAVIVSCEEGQFCNVGWSVPLVKQLSNDINSIVDFKPKMIKLFPSGGYFIGNNDINRWGSWF